jgi:hypothetical protein
MSLFTRINHTEIDNMGAEIGRQSFRSGKERFVVYFIDGDFEYTEGIFKTEPEARICYDKLVTAIEAGWTP